MEASRFPVCGPCGPFLETTMRYFNAQRLPSAIADADLQRFMEAHRVAIRHADAYQAGDATRRRVGESLAVTGGVSSLGAVIAVGMGVLSATVLPVVLPVTLALGVGGLASLVANRLAGERSAARRADAQADLDTMAQDAQRRGLPALPARTDLARRIDAQQAGGDAPGATPTRRPGLA